MGCFGCTLNNGYDFFSYYYSKHSILKEMWPEGARAVTEVTKRPKSTGTRFKESMIQLVENLKTKVHLIEHAAGSLI